MPADKGPTVKRVKAPSTLKVLKEQAAAFAKKQGINAAITQIVYRDARRDFVDVDDEDDFELGMTQAIQSKLNAEITFVIKFEKSASLQEERKEPRDAVEDFDMCDDEEAVQARGIKKNKKDKAGIPRKALKNLINNELQKQSREVFNDLLKSKDLGGFIQEEERPQSTQEGKVVHENV